MPRGFSHLRLDMVPSVAPQRRFQLVGHRGAGSQRTKSRVQENTVLSFLTAIQRGTVDTIELDVQLTRDGVPVIYHDFFLHSSRDESGNESDEYHEADDGEPVRVEMNGTMPAARALADKSRDCRRSGASGSRKPPDGIPIYSLTYDAFKSMTGKRSLRHVKFTTSSLRRGADPASRTTFPFDDWADFTRGAASEGNIGYLQHRLSMEEGHDDQGARGVAMIRDNALPSLRRVLNVLPEHISLMVEIKYPTPELMADTSLPYPERNVFVDRILELRPGCVFDGAQEAERVPGMLSERRRSQRDERALRPARPQRGERGGVRSVGRPGRHGAAERSVVRGAGHRAGDPLGRPQGVHLWEAHRAAGALSSNGGVGRGRGHR
eukprot:ctg_2034.g731